jgi:multidrug transporter EmrE-like cation transporter
MSHLPLILAIIGGLILTAGDIILKRWVATSFGFYYVVGILLYFISLNILAYTYKFEDIAVASLVMVLFNILTLTVIGYFVFKENITIYEITGIALGITAMMFLEFGKK